MTTGAIKLGQIQKARQRNETLSQLFRKDGFIFSVYCLGQRGFEKE